MVKTYKEDEDSDYLVVENPFGMVPPDRRPSDPQSFARLGRWFEVMLGAQYDPIEFVYWTRTRNEVLVKIPKGYDLLALPVLGQHMWPMQKMPPSNVYLYNYKAKGNPANRDGWSETIPDELDKDVNITFPSPYPQPKRYKGHTISQPIKRMGWALPWPQDMLRSPTPEPMVKPEAPGDAKPKTEVDVKPKTEVDVKPKTEADVKSVVPTVKAEHQDQSAKLTSKMDPYEQEEASLQALRSNHYVKREPGNGSVKDEPSEEHKPSPALLEAYLQWRGSAPATNSAGAGPSSTAANTVKTEPVVKPEPGIPPPRQDQNPQAAPSSNVSGYPPVKREPNQPHNLYPPPPGPRQYPYTVKSEPGHDNLSAQGYPRPPGIPQAQHQHSGPGGYSYPSRRDIPGYNQARRDTTTGGGPRAFHPRDLFGPGAQNREVVRFPPPGTIFHGRTQDPRLANRGTKRENDESQDDLSKRQRT